jgi:hypothetical protein
VARAAHGVLDRDPIFGQAENGRIGLFPAQVSLVLDSLGDREKVGVDRRRPRAVRICRMDLRTASRKARLAFSIRCQRSATWVAAGSAAAAA